MKISNRIIINTGTIKIICVILLAYASTRNLIANESIKDINNPAEWSKFDTAIKDPNNPSEMLQTKWNSIAAVLQNKEIDPELKKKIINKIVSPIFDFDLMAKLVLGRTNWPKLNTEEQKKFTELFAEKLKEFYLDKTSFYNNQKVEFKPETKNKSSIYIPMILNTSDKEIEILYKLRKTNEKDAAGTSGYWKIYDMEIEGVSVLLTYQSQFEDILSRGSVKDLFDLLENTPAQ